MGMRITRYFSPVEYDVGKIRNVIDVLNQEIAGPELSVYCVGSMTLPSGISNSLSIHSLDVLTHLSGGQNPSITISWPASGSPVVEMFLKWDTVFICECMARSEEEVARMIDTLVSELNLVTS